MDKYLAQRLGFVLIDVDVEIEREQKTTITDIFKLLGEAAFRDMESAMIKKLSSCTKTVLSTGGGAVLKQKIWMHSGEAGVICLLRALKQY